MKKRVSPMLVASGAVVALACFVLLSMLFYRPEDYFSIADKLSQADGLRFGVARFFFVPLGVGAYLLWLIILAWAVIVFFKEAVGDLSLRAASLVVVVVSGAALVQILGGPHHHLGGNLGFAVASILTPFFGSVIGVVLMAAIFGISFVLATDFGFVPYYREARNALAVSEEETEEEPGGDLIERIERTATEVEKEAETRAPAAVAEIVTRGEDEPMLLEFRSGIEEELLDEELLVGRGGGADAGPSAERRLVRADGTHDDDPTGNQSTAAAPEAAANAENAEATSPTTSGDEPDETRDSMRDLGSVFDTLLGPSLSNAASRMKEASMGAEKEESVATEEEAPIAFEDRYVLVDELYDAPAEEEAETAPAAEAPVREVPDDETEPAGPIEDEEAEEPIVSEDAEAPLPAAEEDESIEEALAPAALAEVEEEVEPPAAEAGVDVESAAPPAETEVVEEEAPPEAEIAESNVEEPSPAAEASEEAAPSVILIDEEISIPPMRERDDGMLPFMDEEVSTGSVSEEDRDEVEEEPEIPVLEDVGEKAREGGVRSIFKRKRSAGKGRDPLLMDAAEVAFEKGRASVVLLQRRLAIGYTRASRLVDALEKEGLVGPLQESGSRQLLMTREEWEEHTGRS